MSRSFVPFRFLLLATLALAAAAVPATSSFAQEEPQPPADAPAPPPTAPAPAPPAAEPPLPEAAQPTAQDMPVAPPEPATPEPPQPVKLPGALTKNTEVLRAGTIGEDPIGKRYLDLVESGAATAKDYNDFAVFLSRRYFLGAAEAFAEKAVDMEGGTVDYWLTLGTVRLNFGKLSSALTAYEKARKLDVNNARAHYGVGVVHDYMRNYDQAVESYTRALALDPTLGDPRKNPAAANNDRLMVVKLLLYQAGGGGLSLPLKGGPADDPLKPKPPVLKNGKKS